MPSSQCHTHTNFVRALRDRICHERKNPGGRKDERNKRVDRHHVGGNLHATQVVVDHLLQTPHVEYRLFTVQILDLRARRSGEGEGVGKSPDSDG